MCLKLLETQSTLLDSPIRNSLLCWRREYSAMESTRQSEYFNLFFRTINSTSLRISAKLSYFFQETPIYNMSTGHFNPYEIISAVEFPDDQMVLLRLKNHLKEGKHNIDLQDDCGETALFHAVRWNNEEAVKLLLEYGADSRIPNQHGDTALNVTAREGFVSCAEMILENSISFKDLGNSSEGDADFRSPLDEAIRNGNLAMVRLFLDYDTPISMENILTVFRSRSPITDDVGIVRLLLERGVDTDAIYGNHTLMSTAIRRNLITMVNLLLEFGVDINSLFCLDEYTPLTYSLVMRKWEIAQLLLQKGASLAPTKKGYQSPLMMAIGGQDVDTVRTFLKYSPDILYKTQKDETVLHVAARHRNTDIMCMLFEYDNGELGLSSLIDHKTREGHTPLRDASAAESLNTVEFLLERGANINVTDCHGQTPLHLAALRSFHQESVKVSYESGSEDESEEEILNCWVRFEIVQCLLSHGANIHVKDIDGRTASQVATSDEVRTLIEESQGSLTKAAIN